jgi:hypothetical protein
MKWKGPTQTPKNNTRILFEIKKSLKVGLYLNGKIYDPPGNLRFDKADKWMYESEAKQILFEHSFPNIKYDES